MPNINATRLTNTKTVNITPSPDLLPLYVTFRRSIRSTDGEKLLHPLPHGKSLEITQAGLFAMLRSWTPEKVKYLLLAMKAILVQSKLVIELNLLYGQIFLLLNNT